MMDLGKLEELAKAATPGPWRGDRIDGTVKYDIVAGDYPNGDYSVVCHGNNNNACDGGYGFTSAENEDYVLAANPSAILELIAEVRRLRDGEPNMRHPKIQHLLSRNARLAIELSIVESIATDPGYEPTPMDGDYWTTLCDKVSEMAKAARGAK